VLPWVFPLGAPPVGVDAGAAPGVLTRLLPRRVELCCASPCLDPLATLALAPRSPFGSLSHSSGFRWGKAARAARLGCCCAAGEPRLNSS
jgi:hypothetical protein